MKEKLFNKNTVNFFLSWNWFVNFSEYIWIISDFFLIYEIFSFVLKKDQKSRNLDMFSQEDYALHSISF